MGKSIIRKETILVILGTLVALLALPSLAFYFLSISFKLPVSEEIFEKAILLIKEEALTTRKGKPYVPDFVYSKLIADVSAYCKGSASKKILTRPEEYDPLLNKKLDLLKMYTVPDEDVSIGYNHFDESEIFQSSYIDLDLDIPVVHLMPVTYCLINRAIWREKHGDFNAALADYTAVLRIAKGLSRELNLIYPMLSISMIQRVDEPLSKFMAWHGSECDAAALTQVQKALTGYEPVIESIEHTWYEIILLYLKMSEAWPRPIDKGINALHVFPGSVPIKWHEKIGYAFLPKSFFKYIAYLQLEQFGFIEASNEWHRAGFIKDAQPSVWHSDARLFLLNQSKDCLHDHPFTSFVYKIFFNSFQRNGVFTTQANLSAYVEKGVRCELVLKNLLNKTLLAKREATIGRQVARDGRFIAYEGGMVKDTKTGLMWAAKDNGKDITWQAAKGYCESYRVGAYTDWRLPTIDELAGIYDKNRKNPQGYRVTKLIDITDCCPWASETRGSEAAYFSLVDGNRVWHSQSHSFYRRALPVRSSK